MIIQSQNLGLDSLVTVSISKHITENFKKIQVPFSKIMDLVKSDFNYSAGTFLNGYRNKSNYGNYSNMIILDVDDGLTIDKAHQMFLPYNHIIATTKSHQREKNGIVCDRFRVLLPTETPITLNEKEYTTLMKSIMRKYSFVDQSCKDASRFYYPSKDSIVSYKYGFINFVWQDLYQEQLELEQLEKDRIKRLRDFNKNSRKKPTDTFETTKEEYLRSILNTDKLLKLIKFDTKFGAGSRNNYLYSIGCYLMDNDMTDEEIISAILWINNQGDGIPEDEIRKTIFKSLKLSF